jgi:multidrug efflux pump subunit AcrA (membrane-fusion protein)
MTRQTETLPTEQIEKQSSGRTLRIAGPVAFLLALVAIYTFPRIERQREALAAILRHRSHIPASFLVHAKQGEPTSELLLPGNIEPLYSANLYARVDGYLDRRVVDIGAKVKSGQVLAIISWPEVDQQLLQAGGRCVCSRGKHHCRTSKRNGKPRERLTSAADAEFRAHRRAV